MIFRDATDDDVRHVVMHMRLHNARECLATRTHDDRELLAAEIVAERQFLIACYAFLAADGEPVVLARAGIYGPSLAYVSFIATDRWPEVAATVYRRLRKHLDVVLIAAKVRRAETRVIDAPLYGDRRWLHRLGFTEEGPCYAYGKLGEKFIQLAWIAPRFRSGLHG